MSAAIGSMPVVSFAYVILLIIVIFSSFISQNIISKYNCRKTMNADVLKDRKAKIIAVATVP